MSEIKIYDYGASICFITGGIVKNISKVAIKSIEVINDRLCIDMGNGAFNNLFIDYPDVVLPLTSDVAALGDALRNMLKSTEDNLFNQLNVLVGTLNEIKLTLDGTHDYFREPLRIDEPTSGLVYKGYSNDFAANPSAPVWAVSETKASGTGTVTRWAGGTKDFLNVWNDRTHLTYLP